MTHTDTLRERLADLCHRQWSGWIKYMFSKGTLHDDGSLTLPAWAVERWTRQINTLYADLPNHEKESDRKETDKFLAIVTPPEGEIDGEAGLKFLEGRLSILRPTKKWIREITLLRNLCYVMKASKTQNKYQALYDEYYRVSQAGQVKSLQGQGFLVTKAKKQEPPDQEEEHHGNVCKRTTPNQINSCL